VKRRFKGKVRLDIRDSTPDWQPFLAPRAPQGAPNVLVIAYDDTGMAAWSPFGGRIDMPTLQRIADRGLIYSQWHTTALCGPTRSCLLTGRNHHQNGSAGLTALARGFPGNNAHVPMEHAYLAQVLRARGWNTFWVGKNDVIATDELAGGASKRNWPLNRGFDRFYGFIAAETNQWYPQLAEDNHYRDLPSAPGQGYHLCQDLADKAISYVRESKQDRPEAPWFMFFCPGAAHAPHHVAKKWRDKYRGKFDDGYEAYRIWVLERMMAREILPRGTALTPLNPLPEGRFSASDRVRPWDSLAPDEKRLFSVLAEVYAGFSEYADYQIGRLIDHLEATEQLENTLVFYCSTCGASADGGPNGSIDGNKLLNGWPDDVHENLALLDQIGGPGTYNNYPAGWAAAFSTPFQMFKRYCHQGGTCAPLVISWPRGIRANGAVRHQYHHANDIVPTILDCCGVQMPRSVQGFSQTPLPGISMRYTFHDAAAPTRKTIQYYEMLGARALWHEGWRVVAEHGPMPSGLGHFGADRWQLFHTAVDRSEARDLSSAHPEKVRELVKRWFREAKKYEVLPLDDLSLGENLDPKLQGPVAARATYTYYPGTPEVPECCAADTHGVSFDVVADVELLTEAAEGVIFAHGSRFGGHALFVKASRLHYVYNFLGLAPEQHIVSDRLIPPGRHALAVEFVKLHHGEYREAHGIATLFVDQRVVARTPIRTQASDFSARGEGLCIGRDGGDAVTAEYRAPFPFTGGLIHRVDFRTEPRRVPRARTSILAIGPH
jgi:arylsulfatase A-like enzyme